MWCLRRRKRKEGPGGRGREGGGEGSRSGVEGGGRGGGDLGEERKGLVWGRRVIEKEEEKIREEGEVEVVEKE